VLTLSPELDFGRKKYFERQEKSTSFINLQLKYAQNFQKIASDWIFIAQNFLKQHNCNKKNIDQIKNTSSSLFWKIFQKINK
jgi:hypothetical protein